MSGEGKAGPPGINARLPFPPGGRGRGRFPTSGPGGDRFPGPTGPGGPPPPFAGNSKRLHISVYRRDFQQLISVLIEGHYYKIK